MADFLLVPGAGGDAWYWHPLVAELTARGHTALAVELPADDPTAGLDRYVDVGTHFFHDVPAALRAEGLAVDFQRRVAQERLGIEPETLQGGHLVALSRRNELADLLVA